MQNIEHEMKLDNPAPCPVSLHPVSLILHLIPEVTKGRSLHNGLGAGEIDTGIETLDQGAVTITGERKPKSRSRVPDTSRHSGTG